MDHNFREMGIGDLAVPKEMRRVAEAFYGRAAAYEAALADGDEAAMEGALTRNVFGTAQPPLGARRLAAYMQAAARQLATQDPAEGKIQFPDPDLVMAREPSRTLPP
jgi:cytochrome b pre-mRNA-processing protein 3